MKRYTDDNIIVYAYPMTDVEYFRKYDDDPSYPDDNPIVGMFAIYIDNKVEHTMFYPNQEKFFEKFKLLEYCSE